MTLFIAAIGDGGDHGWEGDFGKAGMARRAPSPACFTRRTLTRRRIEDSLEQIGQLLATVLVDLVR